MKTCNVCGSVLKLGFGSTYCGFCAVQKPFESGTVVEAMPRQSLRSRPRQASVRKRSKRSKFMKVHQLNFPWYEKVPKSKGLYTL